MDNRPFKFQRGEGRATGRGGNRGRGTYRGQQPPGHYAPSASVSAPPLAFDNRRPEQISQAIPRHPQTAPYSHSEASPFSVATPTPHWNRALTNNTGPSTNTGINHAGTAPAITNNQLDQPLPLTVEQWKAQPWIERLKSQIVSTNPDLIHHIPDEYKQNPDENAFPVLLVDQPLMPQKIAAAEQIWSQLRAEFHKRKQNQGDSSGDEDNSNSDSDDSSMAGAGPAREPLWNGVTESQLFTFVHALPHFLLFNIDFHLTLPKKQCHCPLSKLGMNWRKQFGISDINTCNENRRFEPYPLMSHLTTGPHSGSVLAMAAYQYLIQLYTNYYKGERQFFDHEGIHQGGKQRDEIIAFKEKKKKRFLKEAQDQAETQQLRAVQAESEIVVLRKRTHLLEKENERLNEIGKMFGISGFIGKLEIDPRMMNQYKTTWDNLWTKLKALVLVSKKGALMIDQIQLDLPNKFKLQDTFKQSKKEFSLFADHIDPKKPFNPSFLIPLNVKFAADNDAKKAMKQSKTEDFEATDAGGPSRVFYEQVWLQLGTLCIDFPVVENGKLKEMKVELFDQTCPAGVVPTTNDKLCHKLMIGLGIEPLRPHNNGNELLAILDVDDLLAILAQNPEGKQRLEKARLVYRAVGRIMANCLATGNVISPIALPQLFRNVLIRNIKPSNILYSDMELVLHLSELDVPISTMEYWKIDEEVPGDDPIMKVKMGAEQNLIDSRSFALDSLQEGLTLNGMINFDVTRFMPLEAVNRLTIGRLEVNVDEVIDSFQIDKEFEGDLTDTQKLLFNEVIPEVIREKHETDKDFLSNFLQWCTGQGYMPYKELKPKYAIDFDFVGSHYDDDENFLPTVKTCANYIVLPFGAYNADKERFQKCLEKAMELSKDGFDDS